MERAALRNRACDLVITEIVVATLEDIDPQPPAPGYDVAAQVVE